MKQKLIFADDGYEQFLEYLKSLGARRALLVHGSSMLKLEVGQFLLNLPQQIGVDIVEFTDFAPNPAIESVLKGASLCREKQCDMIIACGGGSAMDVAKCIRLFVEVDMGREDFLSDLKSGRLPLIAIPTTAGTGSEATHFAVIYKDGKKLSIAEKGNIPQAVLLDEKVLAGLPLRQKKATFFDALCHAIESCWSVNATEESRTYAKETIRILIASEPRYLSEECTMADNMAMLLAAHYAGKAINISKTTAGHAMCYKLTSKFGLPHGQAALLCLVELWPYMLEKARADKGLEGNFQEIAEAMGENSSLEAAGKLRELAAKHGMLKPLCPEADDTLIAELTGSVNVERLQNHPLKLSEADFQELYRRILKGNN
ncbi:MAG: phosphonoacetaldehyde reductase [Selenomonas sp.]|nr:phosphonoacetaldehyde reductase [Selenomonas sp.]